MWQYDLQTTQLLIEAFNPLLLVYSLTFNTAGKLFCG